MAGRPPRFGLPAVSPALAYGIRLGAGVCLSIWLAHQPGLATNNSHWILITFLVVAQPAAGGSLLKGLLRGLGTLAAFFTGIALFGAFSQDPPLLLAGLMLVVLVGAYGFTGPRAQYAWFVWAFTTAIIVGSALGGTEHVETIAFQRATMIAIALLIVVVLDALLWPERSEQVLRAGLAGRARDLAAAWRDAGAELGSSPLASQLGLLASIRTEIGVSAERVTMLTRTALSLEALAMRMRGLPGRLDRIVSAPGREHAGALGTRCAEGLEALADGLVADRVPDAHPAALDGPLLALDAAIADDGDRLSRGERGRLRADLRNAVELVGDVERSMDPPVAAEAGSDAPSATDRWRPAIDPLRVQLAIRASIAVAAVLVAVLALDWPMNNIVVPLAFMIACTPTRFVAGKLVVALLVALGLAWAIADLATVAVFTEIGRVPEALVFPFLVSLGLGVATVARPKVAPLVPIVGLLALLPIFAPASAPTDVYGAYNTACYLVLAVGVGWAASRLFWPATALSLFRKRAAVLLDLCVGALAGSWTADAATRRERAGRLLAAYATQTAQIAPLHQQAGLEDPTPGFAADERAALLALIETLFDRALRRRERAEVLGARLPEAAREGLAPLLRAMADEEQALAQSIEWSAVVVRGDDSTLADASPEPRLAGARAAVEEEIAALRGRSDLAAGIAPGEVEAILGAIADRAALAETQRAIENALQEIGEVSETHATPASAGLRPQSTR